MDTIRKIKLIVHNIEDAVIPESRGKCKIIPIIRLDIKPIHSMTMKIVCLIDSFNSNFF